MFIFDDIAGAGAGSGDWTSLTTSREELSNRSHEFLTSETRSVAVTVVLDVIFQMRVAKWKKTGKYEHTKELPIFKSMEPKSELIDPIIDDFIVQDDLNKTAKRIVRSVVDSESVDTIALAMTDLVNLYAKYMSTIEATCFASFTTSPTFDLFKEEPEDYFTFSKPDGQSFQVRWQHGDIRGGPQTLPEAVAHNARTLRSTFSNRTFKDVLAFHFGRYAIIQHPSLFPRFSPRGLGTPGFRKSHQTFLSLTDPGDGHIHGTTRKSRWMSGVIVHCEHLERPTKPVSEQQIEGLTAKPAAKGDESLVRAARTVDETYRIPAPHDYQAVLMLVAADAPVTTYVGRPMFDTFPLDYDKDVIKEVNRVSFALNNAFRNGAAECKISMEGLKASQMLDYMRRIHGAVARERSWQYLSSAFNINTDLLDDLEDPQHPKLITEPLKIGLRGIEIAALGGFDKVTFDGATYKKYPSSPFVEQLNGKETLELIHKAHSYGLLTYFSAGFKFHNIAAAVYSGVDGIGIGGAQVLRHMDAVSGMHGPYLEENIDRIMAARDDAESSCRGRGARLLVRLDQMFFEGSLTREESVLRESLYQALLAVADDKTVTEGLRLLRSLLVDNSAAKEVLRMVTDNDSEDALVGCARRLTRTKKTPELSRIAGEEKWQPFRESLEKALRTPPTTDSLGGDIRSRKLRDLYYSEAWTEFRAAYRKEHGMGGRVLRGERLEMGKLCK